MYLDINLKCILTNLADELVVRVIYKYETLPKFTNTQLSNHLLSIII